MNPTEHLLKYIFSHTAAIAGIAAVTYAIIKWISNIISYVFNSKKLRLEAQKTAFDNTVAELSSEIPTSQLSAAIMLRRFLGKENAKGNNTIERETINVISSLAKTLPTSVFQKTLVDGLAYTTDLSRCDLQKANLQDVLLNNKEHEIIMNFTDLFLADLSYANLENIIGHNVIFYRAILFCTRIKNCDFTNGDFRGADLTNVSFNNVLLHGAKFDGAINIPPTLKEKIVDGICTETCRITAKHDNNSNTIFFSMPGVMSKQDELLTKDYKRILVEHGFEVIYYKSDKYPRFGQFNRVRTSIMQSCAMVAFGLKQINIEKASYRPGTESEVEWSDKWLSTPWSEIEVGMGLMKGLPILLVSDPQINNGVFDHGLSECFVARISTTEDCRKLEQNKAFEEWLSKIS